MANPSLQIGNSNWAIKEDDLLGYSTVGTNYLPKPMTMTRASAGTRVNPQGLVETVELLGSDLITNGDFSTSGDVTTSSFSLGWSIGASDNLGVSIVNNQLLLSRPVGKNSDYGKVYATNGVNSTNVKPSDHSGKTFKLEFEIVSKTGTPVLRWYNNGFITFSDTTLGKKTIYFTSSANRLVVFIQEHEGSSITLDNISLKEVTRDNLARVDYTDGTSSLLVEPQRTNLITYSEDFSQSYWTETDASVSLSTTTSPDGLATSYKLIPDDGTGGNRSIGKSFIGLSNNHTHTCFAKKGEYNYLMLRMRNSPNVGVMFDLENGTLNLNNPGAPYVDSEIESIGNGWYKCSITLDPSQSGTSGQLFISMSVGITGSETNSFSGDGTSGIYIWGCGLEQGSYATSYIPNFGTALGVTRVQDQYEKTGISNLIGQTEGTFFIELSKPVLNFSTQSLISLNNAASNSDANSIAIGFDAGDDFFIRLQSNNVFVFQETETNADANTFYKIAVSYKSGQSLIYIDGSPITPNGGNLSNAFTFTATLDNLSFDFNGNNSLPFFGKVKQLQVYNTALTDTELATLTQ